MSNVEISLVKFEATGCFGTCPIFKMRISGGGSARYDAKMFNQLEGRFEATIKKAQLDSLTKLIEKAEIFKLKDKYAEEITDQPTYTLYVKLKNGQCKTIEDYGPAGPGKLRSIYKFIFSLREPEIWLQFRNND